MSKKIFELAKELDMGAIELVDYLRGKGLAVRNHMQALSDEEAQQFLGELRKEAGGKKKATKKKATKKKAAKKKKVAKKKVVKKKSTEPEKEPLAAEAQEGEAAEAPPPAEEPTREEEEAAAAKDKKTTVIRRKAGKKEPSEEAPKKEEKRIGLRVVSKPPAEKKEEPAEPAAREETVASASTDTPATESADGDRKGKRKRLGDLASMMSGKKMLSRAEAIAKQRSESELKTYSTLGGVGRPIYTQVKRKKIYSGPVKETEVTEIKESKRLVRLHGGATAAHVAKKLKVKFKDMADRCLDLDLLMEADDFIGINLAARIADIYGYKVEDVAFDEREELGKNEADPAEEGRSLPPRNPVVAVMGHVDHGKTTLLDSIRNAKVAQGEAGGITQHIGAYQVPVKNQLLTFLDTPGHEAFASMRSRGARATDIVVLVVAADDGVMPQTEESVRFCKNEETPIIVAVNKMDKEGAKEEKIKTEMVELGLTPEEWGGETQFVPVSALTGDGIDALLESIAAQAELMELTAVDEGLAEGVVIESRVERGRGNVATVLVQNGSLRKGDAIVVGESFGRARSFVDYAGREVETAGPSTPVQILGLNGVPAPGDILNVVKNERQAKKIVHNRIDEKRRLEAGPVKPKVSLEDFFATAVGEGTSEKKSLNLIVRSDVQGTFEAIRQSLEALGTNDIEVKIIGGGVGPVSDSDVHLAESAGAFIIGFNMNPVTSAKRLAQDKGIDVKVYSIIYEIIDDVKAAIEGLFVPDVSEEYIGRADVKETFVVPKVGVIAGSFVVDGKIIIGRNIRVLRDGLAVYEGTISSLRRFKDDVKEVKNHLECGIGVENFNDIKVGDTIECYSVVEKKRNYDDVVKEEALKAKAQRQDEPPAAAP